MFIGGLLLFLACCAFLAGWMFFRDRRRNYVDPRFMKKERAALANGAEVQGAEQVDPLQTKSTADQ
jgi:hypothetical protein